MRSHVSTEESKLKAQLDTTNSETSIWKGPFGPIRAMTHTIITDPKRQYMIGGWATYWRHYCTMIEVQVVG